MTKITDLVDQAMYNPHIVDELPPTGEYLFKLSDPAMILVKAVYVETGTTFVWTMIEDVGEIWSFSGTFTMHTDKPEEIMEAAYTIAVRWYYQHYKSRGRYILGDQELARIQTMMDRDLMKRRTRVIEYDVR
jgi:hypothetical protein